MCEHAKNWRLLHLCGNQLPCHTVRCWKSLLPIVTPNYVIVFFLAEDRSQKSDISAAAHCQYRFVICLFLSWGRRRGQWHSIANFAICHWLASRDKACFALCSGMVDSARPTRLPILRRRLGGGGRHFAVLFMSQFVQSYRISRAGVRKPGPTVALIF